MCTCTLLAGPSRALRVHAAPHTALPRTVLVSDIPVLPSPLGSRGAPRTPHLPRVPPCLQTAGGPHRGSLGGLWGTPVSGRGSPQWIRCPVAAGELYLTFVLLLGFFFYYFYFLIYVDICKVILSSNQICFCTAKCPVSSSGMLQTNSNYFSASSYC